MRIFKTDFTRFFALGFAGGAVLVLGAMGFDHATRMTDSIVPPAQAATSEQ